MGNEGCGDPADVDAPPFLLAHRRLAAPARVAGRTGEGAGNEIGAPPRREVVVEEDAEVVTSPPSEARTT
jgi:hypothetical protein